MLFIRQPIILILALLALLGWGCSCDPVLPVGSEETATEPASQMEVTSQEIASELAREAISQEAIGESLHDGGSSQDATPEQTACVEGAKQACYSGSAETRDKGSCVSGTQVCAQGVWGDCQGEALPQPETCDGKDNDCNGWIDDVTGCVYTIAGTGKEGYQEGKGKVAQFNAPSGLVVTPEGIIYVTDTINQRIRKIDREGNVTTYAGDGTMGFRDGPAAEARFSNPGALALGPDGSLYVADTVNHKIRKIDPQGQVSTFAGSSLGLRDGPATLARFYFPSGLAVDADGNVYVGDTVNHAVRKIDPQGNVTTVAGNGYPGRNNGVGSEARFNNPIGIALGLENVLFLADASNSLIRRIDTREQVTTLAGSGQRGFRDGNAQQAQFYLSPGVAADNKGNVYVADSSNQRIRRISSDGQVFTIAGSGQRGQRDGLGLRAELYGPTGIFVGPHNRLYFTDFNAHTIRVLQLPR